MYDTILTPEEEMQYRKWAFAQAKVAKRDLINDTVDYDLRGYWKENPDAELSQGVHLTDKFKKPNHPTFSNESQYHGTTDATGQTLEGGHWDEKTQTFITGATNRKNMSKQSMDKYFERAEKGWKVKY